MKLIGTVTLSSGAAANITFSSIPTDGTYTDLCLKLNGRLATADNYFTLLINGSTQTLTVKTIRGSGSAVVSEGWSSTYLGIAERSDSTASVFGNTEYYIPNYAGSNYKSISVNSVTENNATAAYTEISSGLWSSTSAISSLGIGNISGGNLAQWTTASLYGVKNS